MIFIKSEPPSAGCGACDARLQVPTCLSHRADAVHQPQLEGEPDRLQQLVQALETDWASQSPAPLSFNALVHSLRVIDGEAALTLTVSAHCGGLLLADSAFQTLRRCLPDTDIYVSPAPAL
jgi:hypothetical protein